MCHGEWKLYKNGEDISYLIPEDKRTLPMSCLGQYEEWYFDDEWNVHWSNYVDGLSAENWIDVNLDWISKFSDWWDYEKIFYAFQENDWRAGSCGGCI